MANLTETDSFDAGVYEFQTTDAALGGPGGVMNTPGGNLANRTRYLFNRITEILSGSSRYVTCTGTVNAIVANYSQAVTALTDGMRCRGKAVGTNTAGATFTPCDGSVAGTTAIAPLAIYGIDGNALTGGEIVGQFELQYAVSLNSGNGGWYLISNPGGYQRAAAAPANDNTSKTASTGWVWTNIQALVASCIGAVATAAGFSISLNDSGYIKLPSWLGSFIFQWGVWTGTTSLTAAGNGSFENITTVNFPLAFTSKCYGFVPSVFDVNGSGLSESVWMQGTLPSTTQGFLWFSCMSANRNMSGYYLCWGK